MPDLERDGVRLHYETAGRGPPVVLCHGFLFDHRMWDEQSADLARDHRVIALDLRGHGASRPAARPFTLEDLVEDVVAVLDAEGAERPVWGGLSLGGMISMRAALRVPGRVRALALLDTDAETWDLAERLRFRSLGLVARAFGIRPVMPRILATMFGETTRRDRADLIEVWRPVIAGQHVPSMLRVIGALGARRPVLDRLPAIRQPTLIMVGQEDTATPPERSRRMHDAMHASQLHLIAGSGHMSAIERPAEVTGRLREFLASLPPADGAGSSA